MKLTLRYIPTEVWVDVFIFPWIIRKKLGRIAHRFRNRKFIEILQYCLHERGKRTLDVISLDKQACIPRTPMPENIKFFKCIEICHFDLLALDFLRHVSLLFIFNDVNLDLFSLERDDMANLHAVLDHLSPLIHGIYSISLDQCAIPLVQQYFAPKLAQIKMLLINFYEPANQAATIQTSINFCMNWLTSEELDPAEPRFLQIYAEWEDFQQFCGAVQQVLNKIKNVCAFQQFFLTKSPCTFAIRRYHYYNRNDDLNFRLDLENNLGEQLHCEFNKDGHFRIFRHPVNLARAQLQEWVGQTAGKCYASNVIELTEVLTIGPLDANAANNGVDDVGEEEDGPSTSKKPKLTK